MAFDYDSCNKDDLGEYAKSFGLELDYFKDLSALIEEVKGAEEKVKKLNLKPVKGMVMRRVSKDVHVEYLVHPVNGRVFEFTSELLAHGLVPCDKNGNRK